MSGKDYQSYVEHLPLPVPVDDIGPFSRYMLDHCPVVHTGSDGGFWVVNRHADLMSVMQAPKVFVSGNRGVRVPQDPPGVDRPPMVPLDSNPPLQQKVRRVMNPFLSPQALAAHEGTMREIIAGMIDEFAADGRCDIIDRLAKRFPSQVTAQVLLRVTDPRQLDNLRYWQRMLSYELHRADPAVVAGIQRDYKEWSRQLVQQRRDEPGDDIVSALIQAELDGRPLLTETDVLGAIQLLVSGGFSTTADATGAIVVRLVEDPALEPMLRARPELIPDAIEEILRLEPPVTTRPRRATEAVEVGGVVIPKGDRVLCSYVSANIDPAEWDESDKFVIGRARNRIMTFGAGPHRCIGSNLARLELKIMVEELLRRVTELRYADELGAREMSFNTFQRVIDSIPITYREYSPA